MSANSAAASSRRTQSSSRNSTSSSTSDDEKISPHLRGMIGYTEKCSHYIRGKDHIVIYYEREQDGKFVRTEFPVPTDVLLAKYKIFETLFDEKILAMTRKVDVELKKYGQEKLAEFLEKKQQMTEILSKYMSGNSDTPVRPNENFEEFDRAMQFLSYPDPKTPSGFFDIGNFTESGLIQTDVENKRVLMNSNGQIVKAPISSKVVHVMIDLAFWTVLYSPKRTEIRSNLHPEIIREYNTHFGWDGRYIPEFRIPKELAYQCLELFKMIE